MSVPVQEVFAPLPQEHLNVPHPWLYRASAMVGSLALSKTIKHINSLGLDKVVETCGSAIIAPRHTTAADPFVLAEAFHRSGNVQLHIMGKREVFENKILGWYLDKVGAFPVDRAQPLHANSLEEMPVSTENHIGKLVSKNALITIFPEGTRRDGQPLQLNRIRRGTAMVALVHGLPIFPVGIAGVENGSGKPIYIVAGERIDVEQVSEGVASDPRRLIKAAQPVRVKLYHGLQMAQNKAEELRANIIVSRKR